MKGKNRIFYLLALFVIEIAGVFGMYNDSQLYDQGYTRPKRARHTYLFTLNLNHPSKVVESPGYPRNDYPPNADFFFEIEIKLDDEVKQMSSRLLVKFEKFLLEKSEYCTKDGLEIFDETGNRVVYCGNEKGRVILSDDTYLQFRFFSNPTIQKRGFRIHAEIYNTECSQTFKHVHYGTFSTPNFPNQYYSNQICVWKIEVTKGMKLYVRFNESFEIMSNNEYFCGQDYLAVSLTGNFRTNNTRYCMSERPEIMISSGNSMLFMFHSDCCFEGTGFSAYFAVLDADGVVRPRPSEMMCDCGKENNLEGERIIGGKTVDPRYRYMFVVGIVRNMTKLFCLGTLISRRYVLTSATCLQNENVVNVHVALEADLKLVPVEGFKMYQNIFHHDFQDIAIITLKDSLFLTKEVGLACLPIYPQFTSPTDFATVTQWGGLNPNSLHFPKELQELQVSIVSNAVCFTSGQLSDNFNKICVNGEDDKVPCKIQSGGGVFVKYDERWFVVGVVSSSTDCVIKTYPAAYTRVSNYLNFISSNTADSPPCDAKKIPLPMEPNLENCGIPNERDEGRIVGGTEADPFEFPWIARIVYNQSFVGVGSLISPKYVLTIASIFDDWSIDGKHITGDLLKHPKIVRVFLGRHRISVVEPRFRIFHVEAGSRQKLLTIFSANDNDLALLKLKKPATGMIYEYRPICLPMYHETYLFSEVMTVANWGRSSTTGKESIRTPLVIPVQSNLKFHLTWNNGTTKRNNAYYEGGPVSDVLLKADLKVWHRESCVEKFPKMFTENMICVSSEIPDKCEGDDGAPLMYLNNGRYYLIGLYFWGNKDNCSTDTHLRVFSAVRPNLHWINDVTGLSVA